MTKSGLILSAAVVISIIFAQPLCGQQTTASQPRSHHDIPINIEAPVEPIPVKGVDGKWYLAYHLFLTNLGFSDLTLKSVEVSDAARKNVLTRYADKELADFYRFRTLLPTPPLSEMPNKQYPRQISSGRTGMGSSAFSLRFGKPT